MSFLFYKCARCARVMCGIVGICGPQEKEWIEAMNVAQQHRGPDGDGVFRDPAGGGVAIANRRLAILDLAGGNQPMSTEDGCFTIVFNGEIFNAAELRRDLEKKGVRFATDHSDTEVVLRGYAAEGAGFVKKLNGMFAFAIFDRDRAQLFLARDHAGIKPLYYFLRDGRFVFASEMKSFLKLPFFRREINHHSLSHYISLKYVPGQETIFEGVRRLPAAHTLTFDLHSQKISIEKFWEPVLGQGPHYSLQEWTLRLREELSQAVSQWTISDVSYACSLSGGLDSSSIVGLLAKQGKKVKTFSLGFSGAGESHWNELPRARRVAEMWQTDHREVVMDADSLLDDLMAMVWHLDEPYGGGLPSWMVFEGMAREVKVGLTGTGGDELFGNYGKWRGKFPWMNFDFRRDFFEKFYYANEEEKRHILAGAGHVKRSHLGTSDFLKFYFDSANAASLRDRIAAVDLATQLPEEFLMMTDRFSMAHSLEARTPFLDKKFMELALSVPANIRTRRFDLKYLLRHVVADVLPPELRRAKKMGFVVPEAIWLRGKLRPLVEHFFNPAYLQKQGIFQPELYDRYIAPHLSGRANFHHQIWTLMMFQLWHHIFIENGAVDKPSYTWEDVISRPSLSEAKP